MRPQASRPGPGLRPYLAATAAYLAFLVVLGALYYVVPWIAARILGC